MLSALMMFRRFRRALRYAMREQGFGALIGAALTLVVVGTLAYTLGEDWSLVDGFYFAVATLTTSSIADPDLVISNSWLKVFTAFYVLVGIGILVEVARHLGFAMIELRQQDLKRRLRPKQRNIQPTAADRQLLRAAVARLLGRKPVQAFAVGKLLGRLGRETRETCV